MAERVRTRTGRRLGRAVLLGAVGLCNRAHLARRSGAELVREDLDWAAVEGAPGRLDWRRYDAIVAVTARRALTVLPIAGGTPPWAGPRPNALPRDPHTYAHF